MDFQKQKDAPPAHRKPITNDLPRSSLLCMSDLQALARASRSGIYNLIAKGKLPPPDVVFSARCKRWTYGSVIDALDALATPAV